MPALKDKNIVVTGATGMVGQYLLESLIPYEPAKIISLSYDDRQYFKHPLIEYRKADLRNLSECDKNIQSEDIVFHLAGIKGSPQLTKTRPNSFFVPTILFNTNVLHVAAQKAEWCLYTSTVGVYGPAQIFYECELWQQFPSENDKFAGWAKRMGELQIEGYGIEEGKKKFSIVRPVNIYGKYDNFNLETAMVIPALIAKASALEDGGKLDVWGNGSPIRDFINAYDVASGMIHCVINDITTPINLGNGSGITIRELVDTICFIFKEKYGKNISPNWLLDKPMGDKMRVASMDLATSLGVQNQKTLYAGLVETIDWYLKTEKLERYDVFSNRL